MILKCIQYVTKENVSLPKDLLSRNVYIDKLDDTIDQYNRTDRRKINVKSVDLRIMYIFSLIKKLMINILVLEFHNTKVFLLRDTLKISLKKIF